MADTKSKIKDQKSKTTKVEEPKKASVKKATVKKTEDVKSTVVAAPVKKAEKILTVDLYGVDGKVSGKISLPEEIFGGEINKKLMAQAVRVYLANKRQGTVATKTRGEVEGSSRKIYRQKGTGRARHGSIRAPIFVHGGVVFGPKPRDFSLELPKKMRRKALFSALAAKLTDGEIKILTGLEALEPKTKKFVEMINKLGLDGKNKKLLVITASEQKNVKLAARNVTGVTTSIVTRMNAFDVLKNRQVVLMKEAIDEMKKVFLAKE